MHLTIHLALDNDAFVVDCEQEVRDILAEIPARLDFDPNQRTIGNPTITLHDCNGNYAGKAILTLDDQEETHI